MAELVGGALLSASLQILFDRLTSPEVSNFFHAKTRNEKLLDRLKTTLCAADAVLDAAEYEQFRDLSVKRWLDDLRDAVYRTNDLLDEISTMAPTQNQVTNFFSRVRCDGRKMGKKIAEITDRLESIMKDKDSFGFEKKARANLSWMIQSLGRTSTTSLEEESDVYGRSDAKDSVIKILLDDKDDDNTPSVIPIVGMGGIGKTTLAQLVYNDDKVEKEFEFKAWVCVSEEFNILNITKTILETVTKSRFDRNDLDSIQLKLKKELSEKKFLIVLDDVWNEDYDQWVLFRKPFRHGAKGSKILLTTRNDDVASIMQRNPAYFNHVGELSHEDSWLLFAKHAFEGLDGAMSSSLEQIGRGIVKKCQGLPLAIKALGGHLGSRRDIDYWKIILKSELWDLPKEGCKILPALGISYLSLPPRLKQCFAYCSLFPKDYEFDKEELIQLWMAEGFLQSSNKEISMEEVGHVSFDALVARSFFQCRTSFEKHFIMHDLIHDLSIFCAGEFCHRLGTGDAIKIPKRTRHLSYDGRKATLQDIEAICTLELESLRSIIIHGVFPPYLAAYEMKAKDVDQLLLKFKLLRALSIAGIQDEVLPDSIGQLTFLRYLNLSFSKFEKLPASLCNLSNLQTLKLSGDTMLPKGINKLKNLRVLSGFMVSKDEGANIGELGGLPNICKLPLVKGLDNVRSSKEAFEARIMDKKFMEELGLFWSHNAVMNDSETERDILDKLQPYSNLRILKISGYSGTTFPDWLGCPSYNCIVDIKLWDCNNCCLLPPLGQLLFLKNLQLGNFGKLVNVGAEFYRSSGSLLTTPFPSLERLEIWSMPVLREWSSTEIEAFPKILHVLFYFCPALVKCCISAKHMVFTRCQSLQFAEQQPYHSLESLYVFGCPSASPFPGDIFPNLKDLEISRKFFSSFPEDGLLPPYLSSLTLRGSSSLTFNLEAFQRLTSLQQLNIVKCSMPGKSEVERLAAMVTKIKVVSCTFACEEVQHL